MEHSDGPPVVASSTVPIHATPDNGRVRVATTIRRGRRLCSDTDEGVVERGLGDDRDVCRPTAGPSGRWRGAVRRRTIVPMSSVVSLRRPSSLAAPLVAVALVVVAASSAAATEFPAGKEGYHSYTELTAEVAAVAAAHPAIVSRFSIGKSYQGRDIWAVKVSDNVTVDEAEPEVLFDGTHHADEHMATEMTLRIFHWLVDGYGDRPADHHRSSTAARSGSSSSSTPTAPSTTSRAAVPLLAQEPPADARLDAIGTDLNRNYGYRWGGGGRTAPTREPITIAARRVLGPRGAGDARLPGQPRVNGRQQIRPPSRSTSRRAGDVAVRLHVDQRPVAT